MNLSFLNPFFMIGLAAVALPVIAHLITRKSGIQKSFPTIKFLTASQGDLASRSRLKDLILLLIRSLIIVLIVLIFAKPALFSFSSNIDNKPLSLAIVIDNSFSMGYEDNYQSAKEHAEKLIDSTADGSFIIVASLVKGPVAADTVLENKNKLRKSLKNIELSKSFADNESRLQEIYSELQKSPLEDKKVLFLTDMQKNGWAEGLLSASWLEIIDISEQPNPSNHSVSDTDLNYETNSVSILSTISNFSDKDVQQLLSSTNLENEEIKKYVDVEAKESSMINVSFKKITDDRAGVGSVRTDHDELKLDDIRYFVIDSDTEAKILIVDGDPREDSRLSESYYLASAFNTIFENEPGIVSVMDNRRFLDEDLQKYNFIYLANVGDLTPGIADKIKEFVSKGGTLAISLGNRVKPGTYNKLLKEIIPGEIQSLDKNKFSIGELKSNIFSKEVSEKSAQIKIEKLYLVKPDSNSETLIETAGGNPFLLTKKFGRGQVFLFTTTTDISWNNFAITPVFLPVLSRIIDSGNQEYSKRRHYTVGDVVKIDILNTARDVIVTGPTGGKYTIGAENTEFTETYNPGVYTVENGDETVYRFAVNINPAESDLTKLHAPQITSGQAQDFQFTKVFKEIGKYFIWGLLALFVSETVFSLLFIKD